MESSFYTKQNWTRLMIFRLFLVLVCLCLVTKGYAQNEKITIEVTNVSLKELIKEIEKQSGCSFFYSDTEIDANRLISFSCKNETLEGVVKKIFTDLDIGFKIQGSEVTLTPKPKKEQKPVKTTLTGFVTDKTNASALPGVNVVLKGTSAGTISDPDGKFSLAIEAANPVLVFSFIGYHSLEVEVGAKSVVNVQLVPDIKSIDEVVVVGYGIESKRLLTGTISTVNVNSFKERSVQTIDAVLQGRSSGVQISPNSGTPGGGMTVRIRGNSSINAGSSPLYVVDGIPVITGDYGQLYYGGQGVNTLSDLNPGDIESISVLKDASASSIYGARASNGVVMITTRRGKSKMTKIAFSGFTGFQKPVKKLKMLNSRQFMEYRNDINASAGLPPQYTQEQMDQNTVDTDWLHEVFLTAPVSSYELSATNGTEKTFYYISGGYYRQKGIVLGTDYRRLNGRLNLDHEVNDRFTLGSNINITHSLNSRVEGDRSIEGVLPNAISISPLISVKNSDGSYNENGAYSNPVANGKEAKNEAYSDRILASVSGIYEVFTNLIFQAKFGYDFLNYQEHSFSPTTTRQGARYNGLALDASNKVMNLTSNTTLDYHTTFGANLHSFGLMLGNSIEKYDRQVIYIEGRDLPSDKFRYPTSAGTFQPPVANPSYSRINSWFTRAKYNYKQKYLVTFNARYDGSSNFGKDHRYGFFPSLSVAWRISEESFMKFIPLIDELKIRASAGTTGNDRIGSFASLALFGGGANYQDQSGIYPMQLENPNLKWETTFEKNVGFDLSLFQQRIIFNFECYQKDTRGLLLQRPIPVSSGFGSINENVGHLQNRGVEISLKTVNFEGLVKWTTEFNLSANRNKLMQYPGNNLMLFGSANNALIEGQAMGVFYGYQWKGIDPATGDCVFADINHDGTITAADMTVIGNPHPDFTGGITNSLRYENFNLNIFVFFSKGNDLFNGSNKFILALSGEDNQTADALRRWRNPGDITDIPRAVENDVNDNVRNSSRYVEDGSFVRIKDITLSYDLPEKLVKRVRISEAKVFCTMQNIFTLTRYSGMDPEVNYAGNDNIRIGTDFFTYPQAKSITFGFNLNF